MARAFAEFYELKVRIDELEPPTTVVRRKDTRIFFGEQEDPERGLGRCVGAFYLQNPGSASPTTQPDYRPDGTKHWPWGEVDYSKEDLIPLIIDTLDDTISDIAGKSPALADAIRQDGYVQMLNVAYLKNPPDRPTKERQKLAIRWWREIVEGGLDQDDVPLTADEFRFLVFGWGNVFKRTKDSGRISHTLASLLPHDVWFVFPTVDAVRSNGEAKMKRVKVEAPDANVIQRTISLENNYPCGGLHERNTYPGLFCKVVSSVLSEILVERHTELPTLSF